jgi:hypothetical protein
MNKNTGPSWLLNDLMLVDGKFDDGGLTVTGRPSLHLRAVLDAGQGCTPVVTLRLSAAQLEQLNQSTNKLS